MDQHDHKQHLASEPTAAASIDAAMDSIRRGLFVVATRDLRGRSVGFLARFVQQVAQQPPTVAVAIAKRLEGLDAVRGCGRFGISILGESGVELAEAFEGGSNQVIALDDLRHGSAPDRPSGPGSPILDGCTAWVDCRIAGEHNAGDHVVVFGVVESGSLNPAPSLPASE